MYCIVILIIVNIFTCRYNTRDSFATDVKLVFDNCSFYNEDDSEVSAC